MPRRTRCHRRRLTLVVETDRGPPRRCVAAQRSLQARVRCRRQNRARRSAHRGGLRQCGSDGKPGQSFCCSPLRLPHALAPSSLPTGPIRPSLAPMDPAAAAGIKASRRANSSCGLPSPGERIQPVVRVPILRCTQDGNSDDAGSDRNGPGCRSPFAPHAARSRATKAACHRSRRHAPLRRARAFAVATLSPPPSRSASAAWAAARAVLASVPAVATWVCNPSILPRGASG
jgi:hypothetical protein